jgi:DNA-directed RNA polymerase subunit M/transcription elongation factor TFIIS
MEFCSNCDNMYYIKMSTDGNSLVKYCRNCGNEHENADNHVIVSTTSFKQSEHSYTNIINQYTKLDPTLPRINTIPCPNASCTSNHEKNSTPREVIYIKYDNINMKFIYLCVHCDTSWKSTNT